MGSIFEPARYLNLVMSAQIALHVHLGSHPNIVNVVDVYDNVIAPKQPQKWGGKSAMSFVVRSNKVCSFFIFIALFRFRSGLAAGLPVGAAVFAPHYRIHGGMQQKNVSFIAANLVSSALSQGGELFARISKKRSFTEAEASVCMRQLANALAHCHSFNIAHRDVKPENLLYATEVEVGATGI